MGKNKNKSFMISLNKNKWDILSIALLLWCIVTFLIIPNINVILEAFKNTSGEYDFSGITKLLKSQFAIKSIKNSIILAFSMVVTVNIVGIFIVLVTEYFDVKGAKILKMGFMTTFVYGGIILVGGYLALYGDNGQITRLLTNVFPSISDNWFGGYWGVLFVSTFAGTTTHFFFLSNSIKSLDNYIIEAARNMKASSFYIIRKVVLPMLLPTILAATTLTFISGLSSFAIPLILGGSDFQTVAPLILALVQMKSSRGLALLLAMFLGLLTVILLIIFKRFEQGASYFSISKTQTKFKKIKIKNKVVNSIVHIFAYILFAIYVLPLITVIIYSFTDGKTIDTGIITFSSFTLKNYTYLFTNSNYYTPFLNSTMFSLTASVIVVLFVYFAIKIMSKYKNKFTSFMDYTLLIPWMLPATMIALGLITAFDSPNVLIFNKVLVGTSAILILGYTIEKIPFTSRLFKAEFAQINPEYELAARNLGANQFYIFLRVIAPILLPTILAILALNFNALYANYETTVFLYPVTHKTVGIVIKEFTSDESIGDTRAMLYVMSTSVIAISGIILGFVYGILLNDNIKIKKWFSKLINKKIAT